MVSAALSIAVWEPRINKFQRACAICIGVAVAFFNPIASNSAFTVVSLMMIPNRCITSPEPDNAARNRSNISVSTPSNALAISTARAAMSADFFTSSSSSKPNAPKNAPASVVNLIICNRLRPISFPIVAENSFALSVFSPNTRPIRSRVSSMLPAFSKADPRNLKPLATPRNDARPAPAATADDPIRRRLVLIRFVTRPNALVAFPARSYARVRPRALPVI